MPSLARKGITVTMFFYLSKILWFLADPGNLLLIALCVSAGLLWTRWTKAAKVVLTATAVVTVLVTILPIGPLLFGNLENRFPQVKKLPPNITGIIVLGGVVDQFISDDRKQVAINGAVERL
ncbi:MAG TPA: YdcF family protein, partial [Rhodospirillales bacterium]|nr:YdcF family protein [Rhodospirillales bacterium]